MSLPIEIIFIIRNFSTNLKDFTSFSNAIGIIVDRNDVYGKYWREMSVPYPKVVCNEHYPVVEWRLNDKPHRTNGPAIVKLYDHEEWYCRGKLHRADGPAVINHHRKEWWCHGQPHRSDGPAVIYSCGRQEWWYHGKYIKYEK